MCEEDTKIAEIFDKDIENFGKDLEKMIEHLNIVIATHNKQVEEIERLNNIINEIKELCENQFIDYRVDYLGNAKKNYAPINTNEIMEIINEEF